MKITLKYDIFTKEKVILHMPEEPFECDANDDASKKPARDRLKELQALKQQGIVVNLHWKVEDSPTRRVVKAKYLKEYVPTYAEKEKEKSYTFEVDFDVKKDQCLTVDDIDNNRQPTGRKKYIRAIEQDHIVQESDLKKEFNLQWLR